MTNWNHNLITNEESSRPFGNYLGYAILNCGAIENLTYSYAATMDGSHLFDTKLRGKWFSDRVKCVIQLLDEVDISDELRQKAIELWSEAKEVMKKRNLIAHNPINHVQIDRDEGGTETLLAVIDMAKSTPNNIQYLDASKISNLANRANQIAHGLFECLKYIEGELADCTES